MSRCFPFPPPGYEKKLRSEQDDLLKKEKHKEKKHKKEKRENEKREGKEKKDKDRKKNKHKEKKDRKEKHKDTKKDKNRDKDKSRNSVESTQKNDDVLRNGRSGGSKQNAEEIKDTRITDELVSRIQNQENQANQTVRSISGLLPRSIEGFGASGAKEKERIAVGRVVENPSCTAHRKNGMVQNIDKITYANERRKRGIGSDAAMQNEKGARVELVQIQNRVGAKQSGTGVGQPQESSMGFTQRRSEGVRTTFVSGSGRGPSDRITSNANDPLQRTDRMGQPRECSSQSVYGKSERMGIKAAVEKENGRGTGLLPDHFTAEQKIPNEMCQQRGQGTVGRVEGKANSKEQETSNGKRVKDKDRNHDEKKKQKDRHKNNEKEKEKRKEKGEKKQKELDAAGENRNQIDNQMPLALRNDKKKATSDDAKKRKDLEANDSLHEHDMRTTKLPRTSPTNPPLENGRTLQPPQRIAPYSSTKPVATHNIEAKRLLDSKERHRNGITEAHHSADVRAPLSSSNSQNDNVTSRPPHADSKYLNQVYSVPTMEEWGDNDDQEWLFCGDHIQQQKNRLNIAESPQVWADAVRIESADITALPYVIPL